MYRNAGAFGAADARAMFDEMVGWLARQQVAKRAAVVTPGSASPTAGPCTSSRA